MVTVGNVQSELLSVTSGETRGLRRQWLYILPTTWLTGLNFSKMKINRDRTGTVPSVFFLMFSDISKITLHSVSHYPLIYEG